MKVNINQIEQLGNALWQNYPCYILYHNYRKTWNVMSIVQFDSLTYPVQNQYTIASQFNDQQYSALSYDQFRLAWLCIYYQLVQYLQDYIEPLRKNILFAEGTNDK